MGLFQSKTGHCEMCGIEFTYEGTVCPTKCTRCRYKERERQNDKAVSFYFQMISPSSYTFLLSIHSLNVHCVTQFLLVKSM